MDNRQEPRVDLSLVVPVFNERESLEPLFDELTAAMDILPYSWEVVFVDDGSHDGSVQLLQELRARDPRVGIVEFRRNFGQTAALSAGFDYAQGDIIITIDADMQNDPADIGQIVGKLQEGYDIVSGWRHLRQDRWLRSYVSRVANRLISRFTGVQLHDYGCTLKAYRREVIKNLRLYGELHRFIPALAHERGAQIVEVKVNHRARRFGESKYNLSRTSRVILDLANVKFLLSYRTKPLQFFGKLGLIGLGSGMVVFFGSVAMKLFQGIDLSGNPMLALSFFLFTAGIQLISIGLVGELVIRAYYETQGKPIYVVKQVLEPGITPKDDEPVLGDVPQ